MKMVESILEELRKGKTGIENEDDIEKLNSCKDEKVEWEPLFSDEEEEIEETLEKLNEANAVTFDGKAYPREGWALIMAGGAGSGKGFVIGRMVLLDAKVVDVDHMKKMYNIMKGGRYDLRNPDDVASLHVELDAKGWKDTTVNLFFSAQKRLNNVIFDITGKSLTSLQRYSRMVKEMGYSVSFVWVVTNRQVAMARNLMRDRIVPQQVFHQIHNQVNDTVLPFLQDTYFSRFVDEAWVVFSGAAVAEIDKHSTTVRDVNLKNRVFKLRKVGNRFTTEVRDKGKVVDIAGKIIDWLGPDEVDYEDPKIYKNYKELEKELSKLEKDEKGRIVPGQKFSARDDRDYDF